MIYSTCPTPHSLLTLLFGDKLQQKEIHATVYSFTIFPTLAESKTVEHSEFLVSAVRYDRVKITKVGFLSFDF